VRCPPAIRGLGLVLRPHARHLGHRIEDQLAYAHRQNRDRARGPDIRLPRARTPPGRRSAAPWRLVDLPALGNALRKREMHPPRLGNPIPAGLVWLLGEHPDS